MAIIDRDVYLLQRRRIAPIDIVYGSAVQIRLNMMDFTIPGNATAEFFAQHGDGPVYRCAGTATGNSASFTPPEGFFQPGDNCLQLEINGKLIPLALAVKCEERISGVGSQETPEQVKPYVTQCQEILAETKTVAVRTPYIGENGNWYVWDSSKNAYADSGVGAVGPKGDAFTYSDFTPEQLAALKGAKGDPFTYDDFTSEQLENLKGTQGDPFTYDDFTPEQLAALKGNTGEPATLLSSVSEYQVGDSGETVPTGSWGTTIPAVDQGKYLWTRVTQTYNTGDPVVFYVAARNGIDGSGSVSSVNNVSPDANGNVPLTAANVGALPTSGGTMTGPIAMGGNKVTGLGAPTADADAATKAYADNMLPKAGGTMTGPIAMGGNKVTGLGAPTADADAATKAYADNMLPKAGGTMTGPIAMGGNKVTGLGAPSADADAVNKGSLLNLIYPIGSIYISTAATSPATLFGGTWERLKDRFLLAAGDTYAAGATGGSETHDHTLDSGFAKISFDYNSKRNNFFAQEYVYSTELYSSDQCQYMPSAPAFYTGTTGINKATKLGGSTDEADNMPPYLAVYMWVRTA